MNWQDKTKEELVAEIELLREKVRELNGNTVHIQPETSAQGQFQIMADHAPVLLRMTNTNNYFNFFSRQWLAFTGRKPEQEVESGWLDSLHPDDIGIALSDTDQAFKKRRSFEITYRLRRHDGEYRWILDHGVPYYDANNVFQGYISSAIDITEHRLVEEEIQRQHAQLKTEENFQKALEKVNLLGFTIERDGTVSFCNDFMLKVTGYSREEVMGQNFFKLFVPEGEKDERWHEFRMALERGGIFNKSERMLMTKDGNVRYVQFHSVMMNNAKGEVSGLTRIGEDVTDKKKVALVLARTNAQLQDVFDNTNDLIQVISLKGNFLFVNHAWKEKLGYESVELEQMNVRDIIHPDFVRSTLRKFSKILRGEKLYKFETVFLNKEGKSIHLAGSVTCRFEHSKPTALRCILYDITDKIRAEKAQNLYHSIANLTIQSENLEDLYQNIHQELGKIIEAKNFYITLYNQEKSYLYFPYYVDEHFEGEVRLNQRRAGKGLTEYAIAYTKSLFLYEDQIIQLAIENKIEIYGIIPKVWLGVPLKIGNRITGIIAVKCYKSRSTYNIKDLELLDFISGQIALAIERKQNEEELSKQTARLNAIFESGSHLMWSVNKRLTLTSFNQNYADAIESQLSFKPELHTGIEKLRWQFTNIIAGEQSLRHTNEYHFWEKKYKMAFEGYPQYFETQVKDQYGRSTWREIFLDPIFLSEGKGAAPRIEEVSGIAHDITQKKYAEIALIQSEEKFRNIFESFQDIYYRSDLKGKIIMISPSVYEMTDYRPMEVMGRKISQFFQDTVQERRVMRELLKFGSVKNFETNVKIKDGTYIPFILNMRLIYDNNNRPIEIEGVARDITKLKNSAQELIKAKEVAEKSLKVKERFLANMSHEIRTPMNGVIGMIDLLNTTPLQKEQKEYVYTIKKSSETLLNILNDILDLSKIEAGKMELHKAPVSLQDTVEKLYALFSQQAGSKKNQLQYFIEPDVPNFIIADETRLLQILSNLTSNAIKFTESGRIYIRVSLSAGKARSNPASPNRSGKNKVLKVEVSDTGIGISKENMSLLFNSFSQLDNSSTKAYGGTGLGLAISRELCRMMNGEIGLVSEVGLGSTFWFTFEAKETSISPHSVNIEEIEFQQKDYFDGRNPLILLVDDNQINRKVASEILIRAGCRVETAYDGKEALRMIGLAYEKQERYYDLIFMDIQMPDMDGITVTAETRKLNILHLPPIIAMTAYSMSEDRERFLSQGMDDYISKPIKAQTLINKVKEWLKQRTSLEETAVASAYPITLALDDSLVINLHNLANGMVEDIPMPNLSHEETTLLITDNHLPALLVINPDAVAQLKKYGGIETVQAAFEDFAIEGEQQLLESEEAAKKEDYKSVLCYLHTLKGNAGTLGLDKLAYLTAALEARLKKNDASELMANLQQLKAELSVFQQCFKQFLLTEESFTDK
ncbi:MAG: PAS domain S-box protein [Bacteroidota bacterium]